MAAITPERVAAMQRLEAAATKGPWRASGSDIDQMTDAGKGYPLDVYPDSAEIVASHWSDDGSTGVVREADAAFIAESRTFVPDLLEAYAAATQWRDMASAPKDGTVVLLHDGKRIGVGSWRSTGGMSTRHHDGSIEKVDFYSWFSHELKGEPTHWLPAPPVQEER